METQIIMQRDLNGQIVRQNTKTTMFNANDLLSIYNLTNPDKPKRIDHYLDNQSTKEYIDLISQDLNTRNSGELELQVIQANRGKVNGGTWMHPYLFIDFAMWLSPEFKLYCVKWIYDNLIQFRIGCGDSFKEVNKELFNKGWYLPKYFQSEANMINYLVFGSTESGQRNNATEDELKLLGQLQKSDIKLIKQGLTYTQRGNKLKELKELLI